MDGIVDKIKSSNAWAIGALLALYRFQTCDEQELRSTTSVNDMGFNKYDANILSHIAQTYLVQKTLTPKQIDIVRLSLPKYWRQLQGINVSPSPVVVQAPQVREVKKAAIGNNGNLFILFTFPKDDKGKEKFMDCLGLIRKIEGGKAKFSHDTKMWEAPLLESNVTLLKKAGFELTEKLSAWYKRITKVPMVRQRFNIKGLKGELYPFQHRGVAFIESRKGRALIGDEMGLGKTAQALAWILLKKAYPAYVVCPATAKLNWELEIKKWLPDNVSCSVIFGKNGYHNGLVSNHSKITVINYDILDSWSDTFTEVNTLVLDEIHYIKNRKAKRSSAVRKLAKKAKHIIGLSGTPIINRPKEFFNGLNILSPEHFPNFWYYAQKFCNPKYGRFGWNFSGASNIEELHKLLVKTVMLRRLKSEVLKELPAKVRTVIPIEISNRDEYQKARDHFIKWVKENYGEAKAARAANAEALAQIESLKQLAIKGKLGNIVAWIRDFLESGEKLVVFATHQNTVDVLKEAFPDSVKLDGRDDARKKQASIESFQNNPNTRLFIGNIKAAGVAINLTAASNTCFVELGWTPGEHDQAEDRVHRIGQTADSVSAYYLIGVETIEEEIAELIDKKRQILSQVLDGKEVGAESILTELLTNVLGR